MEDYDFKRAPFSTVGIVPTEGEIVNAIWARRFARNILGGVGLVGTVQLPAGGSPLFIGLELSRFFKYPPDVQFMIWDGASASWYMPSPNPELTEFFFAVGYDGLYIQANQSARWTDYTIQYRIHGV